VHREPSFFQRTNGEMATLIKKGDWDYLQFYSDGREPKWKKVRLRTRTKATAKVLRRKLEDDYVTGRFDPWVQDPRAYDAIPIESIALNLGDAVALFLKSRAGCGEATVNHYRWVLRHFVRFVGATTRLCSDVRAVAVTEWLEATSANQRSKKTYHKCICVFARFLLKMRSTLVDFSAGVVIRGAPDKIGSKMVSPDELEQIVACARESRTPYIADLATVTFFLALRLSEACAMRWSWIDFVNRTLTVRQCDTFLTTSGRDMIKPIPRAAMEPLWRQSLLGARSEERVFLNTRGRPLAPKHTSKAFKKCVRRAALREAITFHGLRHGGISLALQNGSSVEAVRRFAGHASTRMTMRYAHILDSTYFDSIRAAMDSSFIPFEVEA
jgi:integrase